MQINTITSDTSCTLPASTFPTAITSDNTDKWATTAFVNTFSSNLVLNTGNTGTTKTIAGSKTFGGGINLAGILLTNISLGLTATRVNLLASTGQGQAAGSKINFNNSRYESLNSSSNFITPIVTNSSNYYRVQTGVITGLSTSVTTFTFASPFTAGCTPVVVSSGIGATSGAARNIAMSFGANPHLGGNVVAQSTTTSCSYIAIGF